MEKVKKCPECKSDNILMTTDLHGKKLFSFVCLSCGYLYESPQFKKVSSKLSNDMKNFDRKDILNTKLKILV